MMAEDLMSFNEELSDGSQPLGDSPVSIRPRDGGPHVS